MGHNSPVVDAKFLQTSPFIVSVDEKLNIRIWDVRNQACMQIISHENNTKLPVLGLIVFPNQKMFGVLSKRFMFYDTNQQSHEMSGSDAHLGRGKSTGKLASINEAYGKQNDLQAVSVQFNKYYLNFVVVTKNEVRIYDASTGNLVKVFSEILDKRTNADITSFCFDDRHRKFFIGDTFGSIRVFNMSNGVFIKHVNDIYEDNPFVSGKKRKIIRKDKSKEVSELSFRSFGEWRMLVASSWDSSLMTYDEENPEESQLLRTSIGGHLDEDIIALTVSDHLSLIATGSSCGSIAIWDFENSKLEGTCIGHTKAVSTLSFLDPYPLLVSCSLDGNMLIWGVRPCELRYKYICLARFINFSFDEDKKEEAETGIAKMFTRLNVTTKIEPEVAQAKENQQLLKTLFKKDTLQQNDNYETTDEPERYIYAYIGDEKGLVKTWDLTSVITNYHIKAAKAHREAKLSFNPKRKENLDVTKYA